MRARCIFSLAGPAALVCALLSPINAVADPVLLRDAKQLLAANNPKQAYAILAAKTGSTLG